MAPAAVLARRGGGLFRPTAGAVDHGSTRRREERAGKGRHHDSRHARSPVGNPWPWRPPDGSGHLLSRSYPKLRVRLAQTTRRMIAKCASTGHLEARMVRKPAMRRHNLPNGRGGHTSPNRGSQVQLGSGPRFVHSCARSRRRAPRRSRSSFISSGVPVSATAATVIPFSRIGAATAQWSLAARPRVTA